MSTNRPLYRGKINWFTGDFTSNKNLVAGARNELRNEAYKLGANIVYIQDMKNTNAHGSLGTTNTTAVGKAYRCEERLLGSGTIIGVGS